MNDNQTNSIEERVLWILITIFILVLFAWTCWGCAFPDWNHAPFYSIKSNGYKQYAVFLNYTAVVEPTIEGNLAWQSTMVSPKFPTKVEAELFLDSLVWHKDRLKYVESLEEWK